MIEGIRIKGIQEIEYKSHLTLDEMEELTEERKRMDDEIRQRLENEYNHVIEQMDMKSHNYTLTLGEEAFSRMGSNFDQRG